MRYSRRYVFSPISERHADITLLLYFTTYDDRVGHWYVIPGAVFCLFLRLPTSYVIKKKEHARVLTVQSPNK